MDVVPPVFVKKYDMHDVIREIADDGDFFEIKSDYAKQIITGYCRFNKEIVGLVANNPAHPGGLYEVNACDKYCHFLETLDAYNTPLVNLIDTPPALASEEEEAGGLLRHIGKLVDVYATATIPKIGVVLREAYADCGSLVLSGAKGLGADLTYAWPVARFAIEASEADYRKTYGKGIEEDAYEAYLNRSREKLDVFDVASTWTSHVVDEIIEPKNTRKKIIEALNLTRNKVQKLPSRAKGHGSSPT
jgi:propionyl-CoA carboxylase beta chain